MDALRIERRCWSLLAGGGFATNSVSLGGGWAANRAQKWNPVRPRGGEAL